MIAASNTAIWSHMKAEGDGDPNVVRVSVRQIRRELFVVRGMRADGVIRSSKSYFRETDAIKRARVWEKFLQPQGIYIFIESYSLTLKKASLYLTNQGIPTSRRSAEIQYFGSSNIPDGEQ